MGNMIMERLKKHDFQYRFEHHSYPNANHTLCISDAASVHYYKVYNEFLKQLHLENQ